MSEETKLETSTLEQEQKPILTPFDDGAWVSEPVKQEEKAPTTEQATQAPPPDDEEILEPKDWLKREFDVEDVNVLKAEREEYKKLKEQGGSINFADEQSKHIHELLREGKSKEVKQFLETQERLESLSTIEINSDTAEDIIKLGMQLRNKDLTPKEIEYKFNKQFAIPKEPVQGDIEDDADFEARKMDWKEQVEDAKMNRIIEAKSFRPELQKATTELVLPEIQKRSQSAEKEPTQEELDAFNNAKNAFLQSAEKSINGFTGFSVQVKDKDVDYTVAYSPSQEEKTLISGKIKEFAESGFNVNAVLADRWVEDDGKTINVNQMTEDLSRIFMGKNSEQKIAMDSANKRLEAYLKEKKQINVNEQSHGSQFEPSNNQTEMDKIREQAFS